MNDIRDKLDHVRDRRVAEKQPINRAEACGIVCFMVGSVATSLVVQRIWGKGIAPLGFGLGGGVGAVIGFALGAWLFRESLPRYRAVGFLFAFLGTGACLTIANVTNWSPVAWFTIAAWVIAVFGVSLLLRRHAQKESQGKASQDKHNQH